jgi:hypothetical protein
VVAKFKKVRIYKINFKNIPYLKVFANIYTIAGRPLPPMDLARKTCLQNKYLQTSTPFPPPPLVAIGLGAPATKAVGGKAT